MWTLSYGLRERCLSDDQITTAVNNRKAWLFYTTACLGGNLARFSYKAKQSRDRNPRHPRRVNRAVMIHSTKDYIHPPSHSLPPKRNTWRRQLLTTALWQEGKGEWSMKLS